MTSRVMSRRADAWVPHGSGRKEKKRRGCLICWAAKRLSSRACWAEVIRARGEKEMGCGLFYFFRIKPFLLFFSKQQNLNNF